MVKGLDTFRKYFADYEDQYVLIGGAACDIVFESNDTSFRATRDLDMVLIVEALTPEFGEKFWEFIQDGKIHIDDTVFSLSAILLDDDYYKVLLDGKVIVDDLSVLRPEYLILFKAKAYLDLKQKRERGEIVDFDDIKKHKKDVLRIAAELMLENVANLPTVVKADIDEFIASLSSEPFDNNSLKNYGLKNDEIVSVLNRVFS